MEVINDQAVTDREALDIIERRTKEAEPKYDQKNSLEVLNKFVKLDAAQTKALVSELMKISKVKDRHAVIIANLLPEDKDDLRAVLHKDYNGFTEDEINLILETVKKI